MIAIVPGVIFLVLSLFVIFFRDLNNTNDLVLFYSNLILANIWFASNTN